MGQELSKEAEDLQSELEEALIFAKGAGHPSAYSLGFRVQTMKENVEESVRSLQRTAALQEALKETNWTLTRRINELMQQLADCSENNSEKPREKTELYDSAATRTSDVRTFERTEVADCSGSRAQPVASGQLDSLKKAEYAQADTISTRTSERCADIVTAEADAAVTGGHSTVTAQQNPATSKSDVLSSPTPPAMCGACQKEGARFRCSRCNTICYCSRDCQRKHWKLHKTACITQPPSQQGDADTPPPAFVKAAQEHAKNARVSAVRTAQCCFESGVQALQQQRIDEAIRSFKEALTCPDRHPLGDAAVHTYLGNLYLNNLNDARLAAIHFQDAARLSPSSPDKHLNVALVNFNHLEDVEAAARACLKALALGKVRKPPWTGLVQAQYLLARILSKQGKREEAAVLIREVNNKTNAVDPMVPKLFRWAPEAVGSLQPLGIISPCSAGGKELVAETLSLRPLVLRVRGFLSPKECQGIIDLSKPKMEESVSVHGLSSKDSTKARQHRQSKTGWLPMRQNAILASLRSRLGALLALPASVLEASEQLQVVHYSAGGHYGVHHDAGGLNRRYATVLYYLNTCPAGGQTVFPSAECIDGTRASSPDDETNTPEYVDREGTAVKSSAGLVVPSQMGTAVLFYNFLPDGAIDHQAVHAACRVVRGEKWLANNWITIPE
ncbi:hypothetical protein CYMTET_49570 [Cymbomonas tetramitiformis]|uniref:Procollagen-proline 4-dioxygenase n=1 Tax=Cymbomonas tetramitiformis TaxID=36881 RepID=A0AAE0BPU2_9CHLO|nr:hypothetical protein CYMTET_49570 [Cymbomonas tetramitiformis]